MSLSIHDDANKRRLLVLGDISAKNDQEELIKAINNATGLAVEVVFYDAQFLSNKLIKTLATYSTGENPVSIKTYHSSLSQYLYKLGVASKYVPGKSEHYSTRRFKALALAGSAESLSVILQIIESVPLSNYSIFIVQHVSEKQPNRLDELLKMRTDYSVLMPHDMMEIKPSTIYIAPPGHHLRVHNQHIYLTRDRKVRFARPSIQVLFESLAYEYGPEIMVALLSGYGDDGISALKILRNKGATVLIESPSECKAKALPQTAINSAHYDHILSIKGLQSFFASAVIDDNFPHLATIKLFLSAVQEKYGYDFTGYQSGTLQRRIRILLKTTDVGSYFTLQRQVLTNTDSFEQLFHSFSINISTFFRAPAQLNYLRQNVLPFLESFPHIKVWVAGCSSGEEAYSLAIMFKELNILDKTIIYATDINPKILYEAKNGIYSCQEMSSYEENYRLSGGNKQFSDYITDYGNIFEISPELRQKVLFFRHSLVNDGVFNEFQLIICRNVMIYFSNELQEHVVELFSRSIHRDGFLTLGNKESIKHDARCQYFKIENKQQRVYKCLN